MADKLELRKEKGIPILYYLGMIQLKWLRTATGEVIATLGIKMFQEDKMERGVNMISDTFLTKEGGA